MKKLLFFLILAFGWSWLIWLLEIKLNMHFYLAPFGPSLAGIVVTAVIYGKKGLKDMLQRALRWNFSWKWYLVILFLMPLMTATGLFLALRFGETMPEQGLMLNPLAIITNGITMFILGGPLAEEFGWRGFLLDELLQKIKPLDAGLISGVFWGLWHLPLYFLPGQEIYANTPFLGFLAGAVMYSILYAWIYKKTKRSIFACLIFHTTGNLGQMVFPAMFTKMGGLYSVIFNLILVVILVIFWKEGRAKPVE